MNMIFRILALLSATVALSFAANAADKSDPRVACREDAHSFCADVQPGGGRIINCLQDHYKELSDECYTALQNIPAGGQGRGGNEAPPPPNEGGNVGGPNNDEQRPVSGPSD